MRKDFNPKRAETLAAKSPEMREAVQGYKMIAPHIEYKDRMTINLGERTFELIYLKNVHSEADTAIWMPKERVLFAASAADVRRFINLRPSVVIADVLASYKLMKSLNPEVVVTGHGPADARRKSSTSTKDFIPCCSSGWARWRHRANLSTRSKKNLRCLSTPTGMARTV